jgi:hypothetical protein
MAKKLVIQGRPDKYIVACVKCPYVGANMPVAGQIPQMKCGKSGKNLTCERGFIDATCPLPEA